MSDAAGPTDLAGRGVPRRCVDRALDGADAAALGEGAALLVPLPPSSPTRPLPRPQRAARRGGVAGRIRRARWSRYLTRLQLIALVFPKFSDGRSYSAARLLRERFGYKGEMRATGDVLADQIPLMRRCGIDSFEVQHAPTRRALVEGRSRKCATIYQPIPNGTEVPAGTRPWLRLPTTPHTD